MKYVALALVVGAIIGYLVGVNQNQSANALLEAGFVITDPDGFQVERFDSWADVSYWTTTPKE